MKTYEYKIITVDQSQTITIRQTEEYLNEFGAEGWQIVDRKDYLDGDVSITFMRENP